MKEHCYEPIVKVEYGWRIDYNPCRHYNTLYITIDTKELLFNGVSYNRFNILDINYLNGTIYINVGNRLLSCKLPTATTSCPGLMSPLDKQQLDYIFQLLLDGVDSINFSKNVSWGIHLDLNEDKLILVFVNPVTTLEDLENLPDETEQLVSAQLLKRLIELNNLKYAEELVKYTVSLTINGSSIGSKEVLPGNNCTFSYNLSQGYSFNFLPENVLYNDGVITVSNVTENLNIVLTIVLNKAEVTTPPTVNSLPLSYTGDSQELVTGGTATNGTMYYALGTSSAVTGEWSSSIPTGTDAGTYYVWYKAHGIDGYGESEIGGPVNGGITINRAIPTFTIENPVPTTIADGGSITITVTSNVDGTLTTSSGTGWSATSNTASIANTIHIITVNNLESVIGTGSIAINGIKATFAPTDTQNYATLTEQSILNPAITLLPGQYTITWNKNGATSADIPNTQVTAGNNVVLPTPNPTRDGYIFRGWTTTPGASTSNVDGNTTPTGNVKNIIYYAVWEQEQIVDKYYLGVISDENIQNQTYVNNLINNSTTTTNTPLTSITLPSGATSNNGYEHIFIYPTSWGTPSVIDSGTNLPVGLSPLSDAGINNPSGYGAFFLGDPMSNSGSIYNITWN